MAAFRALYRTAWTSRTGSTPVSTMSSAVSSRRIRSASLFFGQSSNDFELGLDDNRSGSTEEPSVVIWTTKPRAWPKADCASSPSASPKTELTEPINLTRRIVADAVGLGGQPPMLRQRPALLSTGASICYWLNAIRVLLSSAFGFTIAGESLPIRRGECI